MMYCHNIGFLNLAMSSIKGPMNGNRLTQLLISTIHIDTYCTTLSFLLHHPTTWPKTWQVEVMIFHPMLPICKINVEPSACELQHIPNIRSLVTSVIVKVCAVLLHFWHNRILIMDVFLTNWEGWDDYCINAGAHDVGPSFALSN